MAPQGDAYNVDWVFSNTSDVHVATHRDWFVRYTPFRTRFGNIAGAGGTEVQGVGDVELEIRRSAVQGAGRKGSRKIILQDVLYAPGYTCNVFSNDGYGEYDYSLKSDESALLEKNTGVTVGLLDKIQLWKLWLKGQPKGQSSLDPNGIYWINARWPESEKQRWMAHKRSSSAEAGPSTQRPSSTADNDQLTPAEQRFLKQHYGNEYNFLMQHGLKMFKDEDRKEGRRILRALMTDEGDSVEQGPNDYSRHVESGPPHPLLASVPPLTEREKFWLLKDFRGEDQFLLSHGLSVREAHHRAIGRLLLRARMEAAEMDIDLTE